MRVKLFIAFLLLLVSASFAAAQTTEFTYQGKLSDGGAPANGSYDLELRLFDVLAGGAALGTQQKPGVVATAGIFTVQLDFGLSVFSGSPRYLEIRVRPAGSPDPYTVLTPRQPVSSTPYAVRSLNASAADTLSPACVGCVTSTQIGSVSGSTITGPIPAGSLPADSGAYVQNTLSPQAGSNFNISGTGTADILNAGTQYNIGGNRVLSSDARNNLFAGVLAGPNSPNLSALNNSFFGYSAGHVNTSGSDNSFFGSFAGDLNSTGCCNSYFGNYAGFWNQTGNLNSFFGYSAGVSSTAGSNSFFGAFAGRGNTTGTGNSFFGQATGDVNQNGSYNSFFGYHAGKVNTQSYNSFFGTDAGASNTTGFDNAFFGMEAGSHNTTGLDNAFFGTLAGFANSTGGYNAFVGEQAGFSNTTGSKNTFLGYSAGTSNQTGNHNTAVGDNANVGSSNLTFATVIGAGAVVNDSNTVVLGRTGDNVNVPGNLFVKSIPGGGSVNVCRNPAGKISNCSSSLRYKTAVQSFIGGLDIVRRLRPITFNWKDGGMHDIGFGAEEVARVEPLLTTRNEQGQIEGVKYAQITTVLVNAVNEQQTQIEQQRQQIEALKKLVCLSHPTADVCKQP